MDTLAKKRRERGEVNQTDIVPFLSLSKKQLLDLLNSPESVNRTCAAIALGDFKESAVVLRLCSQLSSEKKLYCKIAISDALVNIGSLSVQPLLMLLDKIGNNQETEIPRQGFNKKSYPLPRDIVARTLCRIGPTILPDIFEFIVNAETPKRLEQAIDVLGHIVYTNKLTIDSELLLQIASRHSELSMVQFKITRCFSGFTGHQVKQFLLKRLQSSHIGFQYEAARSLVLSGLGLPNADCDLPQEVQTFAAQLKQSR
ncbi:hypothetical protein L4D76_15525 [Photobacterium sagamiensis]|uniref:hypothetical protein n=1 Tax=Photobacterium sagamiensis TaxID=2910241 RepID=UPI003D112EE9